MWKFLIIIFASLIILIIGVLDDLYQIGIISRIISQIISCLIVIGSGLSIVDIGDYSMFQEFELGMFGILLTVFSVLCLINAINFIDGIIKPLDSTMLLTLLDPVNSLICTLL